MKVSELIEKLKEFPQDLDVLCSKDSEGNGFSSVEVIDKYLFKKEDDNYRIYSDSWDYNDAGFEDEKSWLEFKNNEENQCIVIRP